MKLTKAELKKIIKEELGRFQEGDDTPAPADDQPEPAPEGEGDGGTDVEKVLTAMNKHFDRIDKPKEMNALLIQIVSALMKGGDIPSKLIKKALFNLHSKIKV
jgi:hypothetical protein